MKKTTLLSITGLLAIGLMFGANLVQAQSIGGQHAGTLIRPLVMVEHLSPVSALALTRWWLSSSPREHRGGRRRKQ